MLEQIKHAITSAAASAATLCKVALMSRRPSRVSPTCVSHSLSSEESIIIMGNGPSLRGVLDNHADLLQKYPLMAVNFAANAPEFFTTKPEYYVLADGHFFLGGDKDANVRKLWENIKAATWPMTLFVPVKMKKHLPALPENIHISYFNLTPAEGSRRLCHALFRSGLAMPRPRNVLIPSIMLAMHAGFKKLIVVGADHSWLRSLWVDDKNRVVSIQPHFYKDNDKELDRVAQEYAGYHLHDILRSMYIAFSSYHRIADYATSQGVEILNATPESYIDAFPRVSLDSLND